MIKIGHYATVDVVKIVDFGYYLDGGPYGEVLLPTSSVVGEIAVEDEIKVFFYCDSDDRVIATMHQPLATADQFALLTVKDTGPHGAYLDWGLPKDLLVPFREQSTKMTKGHSYLVRIYVDEITDRLVASGRLGRFLKDKNDGLTVREGLLRRG